MNQQLKELMLAELGPGKREHAFYEEGITYFSGKINRFSLGDKEEHGYFVYVWDEEQQKHVRRWVE